MTGIHYKATLQKNGSLQKRPESVAFAVIPRLWTTVHTS